MILLAGLMGMALVGATVFIGFDGGEEEDDSIAPSGPGSDSDIGDILSGSDADEVLTGTDGEDQINGYDGADTLNGGAGRDDLHGWTGDDRLWGGADSDTLHGEDGDDMLGGDEGDDALYGHNDDDTLWGGAGADMLQGSAGNDALWGEDGDDALHGGLNEDTLHGGAGQDTLFGGWGNDMLDGRETGASEQDFLNGGDGNDAIVAGGFDVVTAGAGADSIFIGDWIAQGEEAQITDFDPTEDRLIIVFDDLASGGDEPVISIARDGLDPDIIHVLMNGELIAAVDSDMAFGVSDLSIMAQSDAATFFGGSAAA